MLDTWEINIDWEPIIIEWEINIDWEPLVIEWEPINIEWVIDKSLFA